MNSQDKDINDGCVFAGEEFVAQLTGEQSHLFGYIATLLGNLQEANDVLQQTNLVLWRRAAQFEPGTSFRAWARKVAYFQTLAFVRDRGRDRLVFDETVLEQLTARTADGDQNVQKVALRDCLSAISDKSLKLVALRYGPDRSIADIADEFNMSEGAVRNALMRIRQALVKCVKRRLSETL